MSRVAHHTLALRETSAPARAARRARAVVAGFAVIGTLAACSEGPSITAGDARARYEAALQDVASATTEGMDLQWTASGRAETQAGESSCIWYSQTLTADTDLGASGMWPRFTEVTEAALTKHGLSPATSVEIPGGHTGVEATGESGAVLQAAAKGKTTMQVHVPVTDGC